MTRLAEVMARSRAWSNNYVAEMESRRTQAMQRDLGIKLWISLAATVIIAGFYR
jgi:hypothetical protein